MKKILGIGNSLVDILVRIPEDSILPRLGLNKGAMQLVDRPLAPPQDFRAGKHGLWPTRPYNRRASKLKNEFLGGQETGVPEELPLQNCPVMKSPGGSAANTVKALAREGIPTAFIGKVANDENGRFFISALKDGGVNTDAIIVADTGPQGSTGTATTLISPDGERTFATCLGVSADLCAADISPATIAAHDILYVEGYLVQNHDLIEAVMKEAKAHGLQVALDLASYNVVEQERAFFAYLVEEYVDILFANPEEATAFTGLPPREAVASLAGEAELAVVKLGADGAVAQMGDTIVERPALRVEHVIDTTGAGDFFAAGFLSAYVRGHSLSECLDHGASLAAKVIQIMGTSLPNE